MTQKSEGIEEERKTLGAVVSLGLTASSSPVLCGAFVCFVKVRVEFQIPKGYLEASNGKLGNIKCTQWGSLEQAKAECLANKGCDGFSFGPNGSGFSGCLKKNRAAGYNGDAAYSGYHKNVVGCCGGEEYALQNGGVCSPSVAVEKLVSQGKSVRQSSIDFSGRPQRAVDGNTDSSYSSASCTHTKKQKNPWWQVDLGATYQITKVVITNRGDCCSERLHNFEINIGSANGSNRNEWCARGLKMGRGETRSYSCPMVGRYVSIKIWDTEYLTLCEVQVYAKVAASAQTYRMLI
ncbi:hypothetical protein BSKO_11708 [Bryopsis sp. KO-2023]|nr:hypothetical protein BSKO_11708 [Bryopsis sp. KO-2023]